MSDDKRPMTMHAARMMLNRNPELRAWAEEYLKKRERAELAKMENANPLSEEEFERHWRYVKPERMHEGAIEAVEAYQRQVMSNQGA
jgi:hypothetical protein